APFDEQAGIPRRALTPAAEQLAALAGGVCDGFEKGAELLEEMASVRLSESTVERTTEDVGRRIEGCLAEGLLFGLAVVWRWYAAARGRRGGGGSLDAAGTRPRGAGGAQGGGRVGERGGA